MKTIIFKSLESTNTYCKQYGDEDMIVLAESQTAGRGTKGRSFASDHGGIYLSMVRHYQNFPCEKAFQILVNSCVAVCKTLQAFGLQPVIRWSNDVLVKDKKICGTLIENTFGGGNITRSIVGIGLNVNNDFDESLQDIAISMAQALKQKVDLFSVQSLLIENLQKQYTVQDYCSYINWLNQKIKVTDSNQTYYAVAENITPDGRLVVRKDGQLITLNSAEVSIRP